MSIESVIETPPLDFSTGTATITTSIGSATITGTNLTTLTVGMILFWLDDAGVTRMGLLATITDATNGALANNALSVATAKALNSSLQASPIFRADNAVNSVAIQPAIATATRFLQIRGKDNISQDEGVRLKELYVRFPYQCTMGQNGLVVAFQYFDGDL